MVKKLTAAQLLARQSQGAKLQTHDRPLEVEGFDQFLTMLQSHCEEMRQHETRMTEAMTQLANAITSSKLDPAFIEKCLSSLVNQRARPTYQFNVERDANGYLTGIIAQPQTIN